MVIRDNLNQIAHNLYLLLSLENVCPGFGHLRTHLTNSVTTTFQRGR